MMSSTGRFSNQIPNASGITLAKNDLQPQRIHNSPTHFLVSRPAVSMRSPALRMACLEGEQMACTLKHAVMQCRSSTHLDGCCTRQDPRKHRRFASLYSYM